jgi:hypothetical protein
MPSLKESNNFKKNISCFYYARIQGKLSTHAVTDKMSGVLPLTFYTLFTVPIYCVPLTIAK